MHVQPWPLANRSTARCWVRERACLRLMLFLFPAPEHPTPLLRAALCGWRGMGEIGPKESELRVDGPTASLSVFSLGNVDLGPLLAVFGGVLGAFGTLCSPNAPSGQCSASRSA